MVIICIQIPLVYYLWEISMIRYRQKIKKNTSQSRKMDFNGEAAYFFQNMKKFSSGII